MQTLATRLHVHATVLQDQIKALVRDIGCLRYWGGNPTASIARPRLIEDVLMCFERKKELMPIEENAQEYLGYDSLSNLFTSTGIWGRLIWYTIRCKCAKAMAHAYGTIYSPPTTRE